jgi:predicted nucleotidyltransferase
MTLEDLPSPVLEGLRRLAAESSARGIRLFLFGSFARGDARPTSDLDLGYEMQGGIQPVNRRWLFDAVDALPTIRPIDLVDFASVSPAFRNIALSEQRDLQ